MLSQGIGGTLESCYIDSPVLHQEASLQKRCALEKNQAAIKLIISSCTPTTSALLLYLYCTTAVWPVRTANNAAIRACTLLLYLHHHCCTYTYRCKCNTHTKLSLPCAMALPRVGHSLTMSNKEESWSSLEMVAGTGALYFRPKGSRAMCLETPPLLYVLYTYRRECATPTKLSLPCVTALPRVEHDLTMSQGRVLE